MAKGLKQTADQILYRAPKKGLGDIQEFRINRRGGAFTVKVNKIASGVSGIGLPAVGAVKGQEELGILVDLYIGLELVFESGEIKTGRYFRMVRKNARNKKWVVPGAPKNKVGKGGNKNTGPSTTEVVTGIIKDLLNPFPF